jgi:hypothetical protein
MTNQLNKRRGARAKTMRRRRRGSRWRCRAQEAIERSIELRREIRWKEMFYELHHPGWRALGDGGFMRVKFLT